MARIFQYAVVYNPKATKDAQGNDTTPKAEMIIEPKFILAKDDKEVGMRAAREIPEGYLDKLDEVEIAVRPF